MRIKITELRKLLEQKLKKAGYTVKEAKIVGDEYLKGELQGNESHGISGFAASYPGKKKMMKKRGRFKVKIKKPAYTYIQGNKDLGQLAADYAIQQAIKKAKKAGIHLVGCGNVHSYMRPGTWAELAAKKGMIALCFNYGGAPKVAPTGACEPILATNPVGIGIPHKPFPIVVDMATSHRAFWHVKKAIRFNEKLDKGMGMDKYGKPVTDPNKLYALNPMGGYKGYILGLILEILTGPFVKTKVGKSTKKVRGFLFIVINPYIFTSKKNFQQDVKKLIRDIKTAKRLKGIKEILIPGERAFTTEQKNLKRGWIKVDKRIINGIKVL